MKRRSAADCCKARRYLRKNRFVEIFSSESFANVRLVLIWLFLMSLDYLLQFRLEYMYPFFLLVQSVYDTYNLQGLLFSMFFSLIAITADFVCFLLVPVEVLFFLASTYVWAQYTWNTDRGLCFPNFCICLTFILVEWLFRVKDLQSLSIPLCQPFAAHCIGYPVVALGFEFKSYIGYKLRLRKQKEIQRQNDKLMRLVQESLPEECRDWMADKWLSSDANQPTDRSLVLTQLPERYRDRVVAGVLDPASEMAPNGNIAHDANGCAVGNSRSNKASTTPVHQLDTDSQSSTTDSVSSSAPPGAPPPKQRVPLPSKGADSNARPRRSAPKSKRPSANGSFTAPPPAAPAAPLHALAPAAAPWSTGGFLDTVRSWLAHAPVLSLLLTVLSWAPPPHSAPPRRTSIGGDDFTEAPGFLDPDPLEPSLGWDGPVAKPSSPLTLDANQTSAPPDAEAAPFAASQPAPIQRMPSNSVSSKRSTSSADGTSAAAVKSSAGRTLSVASQNIAAGGDAVYHQQVVTNGHPALGTDWSSVGSSQSLVAASAATLSRPRCAQCGAATAVQQPLPAHAQSSQTAAAGRASKENNPVMQRLDNDNKRLRSQVQSYQSLEQELRSQIDRLQTEGRAHLTRVNHLTKENDGLQIRLQSAQQARGQERQSVAQLERKLAEEKRQKQSLEQQLALEKKNRQALDDALQRAHDLQQQIKTGDCPSEICRERTKESESELERLSQDLRMRDDQLTRLQADLHQATLTMEERIRECKLLASQLTSRELEMQHLSGSLTDETRIKMDLLSTLCTTRRLLEQSEREKQELASRLQAAEELMERAVAATQPGFGFGPGAVGRAASLRATDATPSPPPGFVAAPQSAAAE